MAYGICYEIRLYANFAVDAENEHDALEIADNLLQSDDFRMDKLIPALDDPWQWGDALGDCKVYVDEGYEDGDPVLDVSKYIKE